ncbi:CBS domain-containing protein, partial [Calidithermus terrae]
GCSGLELLEQFKRERTHMALVVDEYGNLQGLVTLHDILEAIVRRKLSELERRLSQAQADAAPRPSRPAPQEPKPQPKPAKAPAKRTPSFGTDNRAILNGIVWSEILKESKGRAYLNKRNPRLRPRVTR